MYLVSLDTVAEEQLVPRRSAETAPGKLALSLMPLSPGRLHYSFASRPYPRVPLSCEEPMDGRDSRYCVMSMDDYMPMGSTPRLRNQFARVDLEAGCLHESQPIPMSATSVLAHHRSLASSLMLRHPIFSRLF